MILMGGLGGMALALWVTQLPYLPYFKIKKNNKTN